MAGGGEQLDQLIGENQGPGGMPEGYNFPVPSRQRASLVEGAAIIPAEGCGGQEAVWGSPQRSDAE